MAKETSKIISEAFEKIDRADFVPLELKGSANIDEPLPIGEGQTISQPYTVAFMIKLLQPKPGDKIFEIGFGSGWQTALLAYIVSQNGKIYAVERIPKLFEFGTKNISKYNFIKKGIVKTILGDATAGLKKYAPFDKIIASASAQEVPEEWLKELKVSGRLVMPIKNSIWLYVKKSDGGFEKQEFPGFVFVPLIREEKIEGLTAFLIFAILLLFAERELSEKRYESLREQGSIMAISADVCPFFNFYFLEIMAITREQKSNIVEDLTDKFSRAKAAILVDFNKLSMAKTTELRYLLKQIGAEYKVAKKTLINRVLKTKNYTGVDLDELKTQVGIIFSYEDPAPAASSVFKFSKINEALKILGGFLNLNWQSDAKIVELAKLPSREILLGQVVGTIAAPLSGLVNVLSGNIRNLVNLLSNLKVKNN